MRVYSHLYSYPPARIVGGELMTSVLLAALAERGHDVRVATISTLEPFDRGGVRVSGRMVDLLSHQEDAPEVFVTHPELAEHNYHRAAGYGCRTVAVVHNLEPMTLRGLEDYRWDLVVANSHETAAAIADVCDPVVLRPPTRDLRPPSAPLPRRFITQVNLSEPKGGETFWQLAERMPDHHFLGVLGGYGGQIIRDLPNVTITSPTDGMGLIFALTRVLLMPSHKETWGMTACEALVQGIPVIASDLPGPREALDFGGYYFDAPDDVDSWEQALRTLDDPAVYEAAGFNARARGVELLDMTDADLEQWCDMIESL